MQIDFEELKSVMIAVRSKTGDEDSFEITSKDCNLSNKKIYFYLELLEDDGLIKIYDRVEQLHEVMIHRMTSQGFRTLEAMMNDNIWNKIKKQAAELGIEALKQIPSLAIQLLSKD